MFIETNEFYNGIERKLNSIIFLTFENLFNNFVAMNSRSRKNSTDAAK